MSNEDLWHAFPRTLPEFEKRFSSEDACRDYLIQVRWGGTPRCGSCSSEELWLLKKGLWECRRCGFQTSLLTNTPFERSRKPLRLWFRAIWEVVTRKSGVSGKDLQRILGFGSYETAWTWLHKIRRAMVRPGRDRLSGTVEIDETFIGAPEEDVHGRETEDKAIVVVAAEQRGRASRIRLQRIADASAESLRAFVAESVTPGALVITDGWLGYSGLESLGYQHRIKNIKRSGMPAHKLLPRVHRIASLLKRWLMGTLQGGVQQRHLDYYLDEFTFRFNRRTSRSRGLLFYRLMQQAATMMPTPYQDIVRRAKSFDHNI